MSTLFHLTYQITEELKSGYWSSILYIFIKYFLITINHYHNYQIIAIIRNEQNNILLSIIEQLDFSYYLFKTYSTSSFQLILVFIVIVIITGAFLILTVQKICDPKIDIYKSVINIWFIRSIRLFYWIMSFPFLLSATYFLLNNSSNYQIFISSYVIIFTIGFIIFHDFLLLNDQYQKKDFMNIMNSTPLLCSDIILLIQTFLSGFYFCNQQYHIVYITFTFVISLINYIILQGFMFTFGQFQIDYIYQFFNCIYFGFNFGISIQYLINIYDPYCIIAVQILIIVMVSHYNLREKLLNYRFTNSNSVILKLQLLSNFRQLNCSKIYYIGIMNSHYNHSYNKKCFLRYHSIYYNGKQGKTMLLTTKPINIYTYQNLFMKYLKKCIIEIGLKKNPNSTEFLIYYAQLLFYQFNLLNSAQKQIQKLQGKLSFSEQLKIFILKQQIQNKLNNQNQQSYYYKLPFEYYLKCEELIKEFVMTMSKIFELEIYFWKNQLLKLIIQKSQIEICKNIITNINQCQQIWKNLQQFQLTKTSWKFYFLMFKLYILNKKLKVSERKDFSDKFLQKNQILSDEKIEERSSSDEEGDSKSYCNSNIIISNNTAFFKVNHQGTILQASPKAEEIFGYLPNTIKGMRVEHLMPSIIAQNHEKFLKLFYRTGRSMNLYKRRAIVVKHQKGYCFKVQKYLKFIYNITQNRFEYISMMRPVFSRSQYILLNKCWEIDCLSSYLYSIFGDFPLQFLSLCPKAIAYSEYWQFLSTYDMKILSLKLCTLDSKERIQDKKFTYRKKNDQTYSQDRISINSLVFKKELKENKAQNVIDLFKQILTEDNEVEATEQINRVNHIRLNIRVPIYKADMIGDYTLQQYEIRQIFYQGDVSRRVLFRNSQNKIRIDQQEFLQRYRQVKQARKLFRYQQIKNLFENYCQERLLEKVIKVDANLKFYKTLSQTEFIIININRLEIYDEHTNLNEKQEEQQQDNSGQNSQRVNQSDLFRETGFASQYINQIKPYQNSVHQSDYELTSNRDPLLTKSLLGDINLREDFLLTGQEQTYSLHEDNNIFIKEEINKLKKNNKKLNFVIISNRISFLLQICLIILTFFIGQYYFMPISKETIILFDHLYELQMIVVNSYSLLIDIDLINMGLLTSLLIVNPFTKFNTTEQFYNFVQIEMEEYSEYLQTIYKNTEFVKMVYQGFYSDIEDIDISGLDILNEFKVNQLESINSDKSSINNENSILQNYRSYMVSYLQEHLELQIQSRITSILYNEDQYAKFLYTLIPLQVGFFIVSFIITLFLKLQFRQNVNTLINLISYTPFEDKLSAINQHKNILFQLNSLNDYLSTFKPYKKSNLTKEEFIMSQEQEDVKLQKNITKQQIQKLPKINRCNILILLFYGLLILTQYFILNYLIFQNQQNLNQFIIENVDIQEIKYFWLIVDLKEKYIYDNYLNESFYPDILNETFQDFLDDLNSNSPQLYTSTLTFMQFIQDQSLCNQDIDETDLYIFYDLCAELLNGSVNNGLKQFNQNFQQIIINAIDPNDERYTSPDIATLLQYSMAFQIVYQIFLNSKQIWIDEAVSILNSNFTLNLICCLIQLFILLLLYVIIMEMYLFIKEENDFFFSKKYYKYFMLNKTINDVKKMRVDLVKTGLLSK